MAESKAAKLASGWSSRKQAPDESDLKGLPRNVQDAVLDVVRVSSDIGERVALAEQLWERDAEHPLALGPDHGQSTQAYRFEVVDGEIVEIRKDSHDAPVRILHRPDLTPPDEIDPAAEIQARLQAPEPVED